MSLDELSLCIASLANVDVVILVSALGKDDLGEHEMPVSVRLEGQRWHIACFEIFSKNRPSFLRHLLQMHLSEMSREHEE